MLEEKIARILKEYLVSPYALHLAAGYGVRPIEAFGEIFLKLRSRAPSQIDNIKSWVCTNAQYHLRNYLNSEKRFKIYQKREN